MGNQVYLGRGKLRALFLFSLLVLGNTETKAARMVSIKGLGDPDFHPFGFGIFDQHADPSRNLQNCPVTSHYLE
jgi:hypothetical protein